MGFSHRIVASRIALVMGSLLLVTGAASSGADPVGSLEFCSDLAFTKCKTALSGSEDIYVRAKFPTSVGQVFQDSFGGDHIPSSGKFAFVIAKNLEDEHAILESFGNIMVSRYAKQATFDLTLQASEKSVERIAASGDAVSKVVPFNSIGTMGQTGLSAAWANKAVGFPDGDAKWEAFLIFIPANEGGGDPKLVASGKLSYNMTGVGRSKLIEGMNFYDKQRFEKTPDDGITTAVHKANVGKIVFGRKKMIKGFDDKSALESSLKGLGDGVYARLYMKQSMRNFLADHGDGKDVSDVVYDMEIKVDGTTTRVIAEKLTQAEAMKLTSFSLTLVPASAAEAEDMPRFTRKFVYLMSMLAPGKHKVAIRALLQAGGQKMELSSGELEVDIVAKDRDAVAKKWGNKLAEMGMMSIDKKLAAELRKILAKTAVAIRAPIGWELHRNAFGVVTHRTSTIQTGYKEGAECRLGSVNIQQDFVGNKFGPTSWGQARGYSNDDNDLPCQNLIK